jgi:hypothetical protein
MSDRDASGAPSSTLLDDFIAHADPADLKGFSTDLVREVFAARGMPSQGMFDHYAERNRSAAAAERAEIKVVAADAEEKMLAAIEAGEGDLIGTNLRTGEHMAFPRATIREARIRPGASTIELPGEGSLKLHNCRYVKLGADGPNHGTAVPAEARINGVDSRHPTREAALAAAWDRGERPAKNISWGRFREQLAKECGSSPDDRGFGEKQLRRLLQKYCRSLK